MLSKVLQFAKERPRALAVVCSTLVVGLVVRDSWPLIVVAFGAALWFALGSKRRADLVPQVREVVKSAPEWLTSYSRSYLLNRCVGAKWSTACDALQLGTKTKSAWSGDVQFEPLRRMNCRVVDSGSSRRVEWEVRLPAGWSAEDILRHRERLRHSLGVFALDVSESSPGTLAFSAEPTAFEFPEVVSYPERFASSLHAVPVGVDAAGDVVTLPLAESSVLVAGLPGSGKSGFLNSLISGALAVGPSVSLYGLDPKRVELAAWSCAFTQIATEDDDFLPLLNDLADEMNARYAYLAEHGLRKFERFDEVRPLILLVVDELAEIVSSADAKRDKAHAAALRLLVQKGRAAGICVTVATQRPSSDVIPTSLRDLFLYRVSFATATREATKMVLGELPEDAAVLPHDLTPGQRGVGFRFDGRELVQFKSFWLDDERVSNLAKRYGKVRHDGV